MTVQGAVQANQLYWWQDARGVIHITDEPPPDGVDYEVREVESGGSAAEQTSTAVRDQRCQDFQGALEQLRGVDNVNDTAQWRSAKQRAQHKIQQWCHEG